MDRATQAARLIANAIGEGGVIDALPEQIVPDGAADAYAIQDGILKILGGPAAWKLTTETTPRVSPVPAAMVSKSPATLPNVASLKIEVEVALVLGQDVSTPQTATSISSSIASYSAAFEVIRSRFKSPQPQPSSMADLMSCHAVVVGTPIAWGGDFADIPMGLIIDGELVERSMNGPSTADMLAATAWLANHALARGIPLRKGQTVITGARIKHPVTAVPARLEIVAGTSTSPLAKLTLR